MDQQAGEVVLLTGSNGFLGSHVLKHLVNDAGVKEIRALDKSRGSEDGQHRDGKVRLYELDLTDLESCRHAFRGVDVVLHCAGLVDYGYPANVDELHRNNVLATENVVQLCVDESVPRLVHCSTAEVTLQSCFTGGIVAVSIFKQESKLEVPQSERKLIFGEYAASKLRAERLVLAAHERQLANGRDQLRTVALRPTPLYGDGDVHLLPRILELAARHSLPRFWGIGGKQQLTYVGNAAWAFIRAKETLRETPEAIAGLPVTITDDTVVEDLPHFCQRITKDSGNPVRVSEWSVPLHLSYAGACLYDWLTYFGLVDKLGVSPSSSIAFFGSIILYNRARASIHMNYWPKYTNEQTLAIASKYYAELCTKKP